MHHAVSNAPEKRLAVAGADGDKMPSRGGVIPSPQACGFDAVFVFESRCLGGV